MEQELENKIKRIIDWLLMDIAEEEAFIRKWEDIDEDTVRYNRGIKVQAEVDLQRVRELLK